MASGRLFASTGHKEGSVFWTLKTRRTRDVNAGLLSKMLHNSFNWHKHCVTTARAEKAADGKKNTDLPSKFRQECSGNV